MAMTLADNSNNGRAGNSGRNRGSDRATTINQNTAAAGGGSGGSSSVGRSLSMIQIYASRFTNVFFFDGASNVQKAGEVLMAKFPCTFCFYSREHVTAVGHMSGGIFIPAKMARLAKS